LNELEKKNGSISYLTKYLSVYIEEYKGRDLLGAELLHDRSSEICHEEASQSKQL